MEKVLFWLLAANAILSGASVTLHKLVEQFPALANADSIAGKLVAALQKIVDFLSANVAHKQAEASAPAPAVEAPKA